MAGSAVRFRRCAWLKSCDHCAYQEGRHYCLLHGVQVRDMDLRHCSEWASKHDQPNGGDERRSPERPTAPSVPHTTENPRR